MIFLSFRETLTQREAAEHTVEEEGMIFCVVPLLKTALLLFSLLFTNGEATATRLATLPHDGQTYTKSDGTKSDIRRTDGFHNTAAREAEASGGTRESSPERRRESSYSARESERIMFA